MRSASLRRHLLLWLVPSLAALLAINALLTYRTAVENANTAYDHLLAGAARAISDGTHQNVATVLNLTATDVETTLADLTFQFRETLALGVAQRFWTEFGQIPPEIA